ncbi:MAG: PTS transporter subunit EIIB, partial [Aeromonas sp.]
MAKVRDYAQLARDILALVGGQENIVSFSRCATRLRLVLKNTPEQAEARVKGLPGVITVVLSGGQFQIVIGAHVADVFDALGGMVDANLQKEGEHKVRL